MNKTGKKQITQKKIIGKKVMKNILTITFDVLYAKIEKIYPANVSKQNSKREK